MAFDPTLPYSSVETAGGFQCNLQYGSYWSKVPSYASVTLPVGYIDPSASPVKWVDASGSLLIKPSVISTCNGTIVAGNLAVCDATNAANSWKQISNSSLVH